MACRQLAPDTPEVAELAGAGAELPWLSVWTADDAVVTPPETAVLPGAVNVAVQAMCPGARVTHAELPTNPVVIGLVLRALGTGPIPAGGECAELRAAGSS